MIAYKWCGVVFLQVQSIFYFRRIRNRQFKKHRASQRDLAGLSAEAGPSINKTDHRVTKKRLWLIAEAA
jgi:hypothetical protein